MPAATRALPRLRQHADLSRLDHPVSDRGGARSQRSGIHLWPARHADREGAAEAASPSSRAVMPRCSRRRGSRPSPRPSSPFSRGRPCAGLRQRLPADAAVLRQRAEASRDRDHLLRSAGRRRHQGPLQTQHQDGLCRVSRLADLRGAGRSGHRRGGARGRRFPGAWTIPGRRRSSSNPSRMAPMCPSRRRPSTSSAMPTRCSAPSPRTKPSGRRSRARMTILASAPVLKTSISACAACGALACGWRGIRLPPWRSPSGSRRGPKSPASSTPPLPSDPGHAIWQRDFTGACGLFSSC